MLLKSEERERGNHLIMNVYTYVLKHLDKSLIRPLIITLSVTTSVVVLFIVSDNIQEIPIISGIEESEPSMVLHDSAQTDQIEMKRVPEFWLQPRAFSDGNPVWGPDITTPFEIIWKIDTGRELFAGPVLLDGILYFGGNDGLFRAVSAGNGSFIWSFNINCGICGEAAVDSSMVYFGGQDGYLYALSRKNGSRIWSAGIGYHIFAGTAILSDTLVITGNSAGNIVALRCSDGELVWSDSPGGVVLGPAVSASIIVFTTENGIVAAYNPGGERIWIHDFSGTASAPSISDSCVFVGFSDGTIRSFQLNTGEILWSTDLTSSSIRTVISRPVTVDDQLFAGTCDSRLVCINLSSGDIQWEQNFENWVQVAPIVGKNLIYLPCDDQRLHVIDRFSGTKLDSIEIYGYAGTPPLLADSVLYLGTTSGEFMALRGRFPEETSSDEVQEEVQEEEVQEEEEEIDNENE